ncbi:hypothetical protein [Hyphococcus sp.]|uniref:hypothetical protein n=1 Tax=Hyphococcus sp. TaxID=2038636 RepID=UPI0035C6FF2B
MTTRRTILQGAASLIAPADFDLNNPFDVTAAESPFGILISEYRHMVAQLESIMAERNRVEADASARYKTFNDCPELAAVEDNERAWFAAEKKLIQFGARTRAGTFEEIAQKLILWRLTDHDARSFDNPFDMLAFAAYRDLLLLTGRTSLTPKADEKCLATIWNDSAFHYDDDEEDYYDDDDDEDLEEEDGE